MRARDVLHVRRAMYIITHLALHVYEHRTQARKQVNTSFIYTVLDI